MQQYAFTAEPLLNTANVWENGGAPQGQRYSSTVGTPTVAEYVLGRLADLGIDRVFGVPGDYSFPIDDAIETSTRLSWVVCANELNAAYAADGYARRRGASILTTTYGVGELSAINGVMGAKAHRVPIFHVAGEPSTRIQRLGLPTHHTMGDGVFGNFFTMSAACCGVSARITPDNAVQEMERVIGEALRLSQPAFIQIPQDFALMPVLGTPVHGAALPEAAKSRSESTEVAAAVRAINERLAVAKRPVAMPTLQVGRYHAQKQVLSFLKRSRIPFSLTTLDKGVLDERHPGYLGLYVGEKSAPATAGRAVLSADLVLCLGEVIQEDFNTGNWSAMLDPDRMIVLGPDYVRIDDRVFTACMLPDVVAGLARTAKPVPARRHPAPRQLPMTGKVTDLTSSAALYPRLQRFLQAGDILIVDGGSAVGKCAPLLLPEGVGFESQILWGSIGWATPCTLGVAMAEPDSRAITITGDGAHPLTANEIGVMGRYGVNPIIIVLNNGIYGAEDVASQRGHVYDDLARWNYHQLPAAMGCKDWYCARIQTVGELEAALDQARHHPGGVYLEVMIPDTESQPWPQPELDRLYKLKS